MFQVQENPRIITMRDGRYLAENESRFKYLLARYRLESALEKVFTNLQFRVWNIPWFTGDQDRHMKYECAPTTVWVRGRILSWSGFSFHWPLSSEDKATLRKINEEAGALKNTSYFYCSRCMTAQHVDNLGLATGGEVRCIDCLDHNWVEEARKFIGF